MIMMIMMIMMMRSNLNDISGILSSCDKFLFIYFCTPEQRGNSFSRI